MLETDCCNNSDDYSIVRVMVEKGEGVSVQIWQ